jgi:hypothetical protein
MPFNIAPVAVNIVSWVLPEVPAAGAEDEPDDTGADHALEDPERQRQQPLARPLICGKPGHRQCGAAYMDCRPW